MNIDKLKDNWDQLGKDDPMWAILTTEEYKDNKWDEEKFFHTGEKAIFRVFRRLTNKNMEVNTGRALDFGCGIGRLSRAMCDRFNEVHGVDIAQSMIDLANEKNKYPDRCHFHVNEKSDLSLFEDSYFDFVLTFIVLQHMKPQYAKKYLTEFMRITRPGGLVVFQLPSEPDEETREAKNLTLKKRWKKFKRWIKGNEPKGPVIDMNWVPKAEVEQLVKDHNGFIEDLQLDKQVGVGWTSYTYFVRKNS